MNSVTFLGTGGGRFVFLTQRRYSGGLWLELDGARIILDPGPGSLVRALQFGKDPGRLDCIISSHKHLDHYNDVEVMIEAMTHGLNRRQGLLVLQEGVVEYVSDYHRAAAECLVPSAEARFSVGDVQVEALPTFNHAGGLGFRFKTSDGDIVYSGDTSLDEDLIRHYKGADLLILNTIFGRVRGSDTHLNTEDAAEIARMARPKRLIITHFGVRLLNEGPDRVAARIEADSGVPTTAAEDGMTVKLSRRREK